MGKTKPPYPAAFKQQIVELFQAGRSQSELAREFDVSAGSIANWVARAANAARRWVCGLAWAASEMPMTTLWPRASLPAWSVS